jgi:hypothetical protein
VKKLKLDLDLVPPQAEALSASGRTVMVVANALRLLISRERT